MSRSLLPAQSGAQGAKEVPKATGCRQWGIEVSRFGDVLQENHGGKLGGVTWYSFHSGDVPGK